MGRKKIEEVIMSNYKSISISVFTGLLLILFLSVNSNSNIFMKEDDKLRKHIENLEEQNKFLARFANKISFGSKVVGQYIGFEDLKIGKNEEINLISVLNDDANYIAKNYERKIINTIKEKRNDVSYTPVHLSDIENNSELINSLIREGLDKFINIFIIGKSNNILLLMSIDGRESKEELILIEKIFSNILNNIVIE